MSRISNVCIVCVNSIYVRLDVVIDYDVRDAVIIFITSESANKACLRNYDRGYTWMFR